MNNNRIIKQVRNSKNKDKDRKYLKMVWLLLVFLVILDQISKIIIRNKVALNKSFPVIDNFFYISNRKNKGAAWSFLADHNWGIYLLSFISLIASVLMIYLIYKTNNTRLKVVVALICAGSIGNLIDRLFLGGVTDFLEFHFGSYIFPTFNIADSLIVCGTIALFFLLLLDKSILQNWQ